MRNSGWGVLVLSLFSPLGFLFVIVLFVLLLLWIAIYQCYTHPWHIVVFTACLAVIIFTEFIFRKVKPRFPHLWTYHVLKSTSLIVFTIATYAISVLCCFFSYTTEVDSLEAYKFNPSPEESDIDIIPNVYFGQDKYSFYYNMCLFAYRSDSKFGNTINSCQFRWHAFFYQDKLYRLLFYGNHPRNVGVLMETLESFMDPSYNKVDRTTYNYRVVPAEFEVADKLMVDDFLSVHIRHNDEWRFIDSLQYNTVIDIKWQSLLKENFANLTSRWGDPLP